MSPAALSAAGAWLAVAALLGLGLGAGAGRPRGAAAAAGALLVLAESALALSAPQPLDPPVVAAELIGLALAAAAALGAAARSSWGLGLVLALLGAIYGPELARAAGAPAAALSLGLPLGLLLGALAWPRARRGLPLALALLGAAGPALRAAQGAPGAPATAPALRPLLLITVDTVRGDDGLLDDPAFAPEAGVWRTDAAVAAAPWTLPALLSLLWAAPVAEHRGGLVGPLGPTLPVGGRPPPVRKGGLALLSNPYLRAERGFGDRVERLLHVDHAREPLTLVQNIDGAWARAAGGRPRRAEAGDAAVERAAIAALRAGQPFVWAHLLAPHEHRRGCVGAAAEGRCAEAAVRARHAALVDETRARLLRILAADPDRISVVVGDHGEAFGEGGLHGHGLSFQDAELLVPLAIRLPGAPGGPLPGPVAVAELGGWLQVAMDGAPLPAGAPLPPARGAAVPVAGLRRGGGAAARWVGPGRVEPEPTLPVDGPAPVIDGATRRALELLGYIDGEVSPAPAAPRPGATTGEGR